MKYFFILGSNPTLSLAEISAVFGLEKNKGFLFFAPDCFILDLDKQLEVKELMSKLGGTIKIGRIAGELQNYSQDKILSQAVEIIGRRDISGKFPFGLSYYGKHNLNGKALGMEIKRELKEKGISSRWVISREKTLSSVVVEQNKLADKGIELVLIFDGQKAYLGETLAVQPFKELSFRDFGRPARDDYSGMLPPKLAQIMINLALPLPSGSPLLNRRGARGEVLLDPFCGSGTILSEAMLMGYENLIGSDISPKAIENTKKNCDWIIENWKPARSADGLIVESLKLYQHDTRFLSKIIKSQTIDAIVTEPYLGPQRGAHDMGKIKKELEVLYSNALDEFTKILKNNGRIVMAWPMFYEKLHTIRLELNLNKFKIVPPLPDVLAKNKYLKLTPRNTIVYHRPEQKVGREIVILEKKLA